MRIGIAMTAIAILATVIVGPLAVASDDVPAEIVTTWATPVPPTMSDEEIDQLIALLIEVLEDILADLPQEPTPEPTPVEPDETLVDQLVALLIEILEDILNREPAT